MRLTRKELVFTVGLTTNFDACMPNDTYVRIGIVHTCGHVSVFCLSFVHQSVASARLSVHPMIVYYYLPSVHLSDIPSVRLYVCLYVHMDLCRDERTIVCTVDIEN